MNDLSLSLSLSTINNSNFPVDPWALALHTQQITSTIPEQSNSMMNATNLKVVGLILRYSPSISTGIAFGILLEASYFMRMGSTSAESTVFVNGTQSLLLF
jgi:hypothetical protein